VELTLFVCRLRVACNEATIYSVYARSLARREREREREREKEGHRVPRASRAPSIQDVEESIERERNIGREKRAVRYMGPELEGAREKELARRGKNLNRG